MDHSRFPGLDGLLAALGLDEAPMGIFYSDTRPEDAISPNDHDPPTRAREAAGEVNWGEIFGDVSCVIGHIWRARRRRTTAAFSLREFGCPGAACYLGFIGPQTETVIHYVTTGFPGHMEGECYLAAPDAFRRILTDWAPVPAPKPYLLVKPVETLTPEEQPELVAFYARPEAMSGLHQLVCYLTGEPDTVQSPWGAACGGLVMWPYWFRAQGRYVATLGGWDPSARKFFKTDELSLTIPMAMFEDMLARWQDSFLTRHAWKTARKKVDRSRKAWGEAPVPAE